MRKGSQAPTFSRVGDYATSLGTSVAKVFEGWGVKFIPCQKKELTLMLARDESGRFAAKTLGIAKPRQNGKSYGARVYAIWMAAGEDKRVLYTAHHGKTTRKMFRMIRDFIVRNGELSKLLQPNGIYQERGNEGIYFARGGCIEFQTRTTGGARGDTYDIIIIDEAQELTYDEWDAVKPTTLAASDVEEDDAGPQMIYIGTPPGPKCPGDVFRDMHDVAHSEEPGGAWWLEWSTDTIPEMDDSEAVLGVAYKTNPAMGYRIREDVMLDAIDGYRNKPDSFAREYLGWWSPVAKVTSAIDPAVWDECAIEKGDEGGKLAYGIKFSPDGIYCAIAGCSLVSGKVPHVELIAYKNVSATGIKWVEDFILERRKKAALVAIDGKAYADDLATRLREASYPVKGFTRTGTRDVIAASSMFANAVTEHAVTHIKQPMLDESVGTSTKRLIGNNGGFGFGGECPEPLVAASLALWAVRTTKRNPARKAIVR